MYCICGSTACVCENLCRCCPVRDRCQCLQCAESRRQRGGVYCDHCNGFVPTIICTHIHEWARTGMCPNLDCRPEIPAQPSCTNPDEGTRMTRSVPEATLKTPAESQSDDSLIFQIDDIDEDLPGALTSIQTHLKTSFSGRPQVAANATVNGRSVNRNRSHLPESRDTEIQSLHHPNLPVLELTESRVSETPILQHHRRFSQINHDANFSNPRIDEIPYLCRGIVPIFECTESQIREMPMHHDLSVYSQAAVADILRSRPSYVIETPTICESTIPVSERTKSHVNEIPIPHYLPGFSRHSPKESAFKPEESEMNDYAWCKIPSPSNEYVSERKESYISEISSLEDLTRCSRYNLTKFVSKSEEARENADASYMTLSPSDGYSSDSLPSLPSTSSYESSSSLFLANARSPTRPLSTSAPSVYDISEPLSQLESSVTTRTYETVPASDLSQLETLTIADTIDKAKTMSEPSSRIETLPPNMANGTDNINEHPDLSAVCEIPTTFNSILVHNTQIQDEFIKESTSPKSLAANRTKLPSPEVWKAAKRRKS